MKPRILILSTAYLPHIGGSELAIHHIAERLTDVDVDVVDVVEVVFIQSTIVFLVV